MELELVEREGSLPDIPSPGNPLGVVGRPAAVLKGNFLGEVGTAESE